MTTNSDRYASAPQADQPSCDQETLKSEKSQQMLIMIRSSFWFLPTLIMLAAIGLALGLVEIDRHAGEAL